MLLLAYVLQCAWFIRTQSLTFDEPPHILAGLEAWRGHRFEVWNDHPPLARLLCTLPLVGSRWQMDVRPEPGGGWHVPQVTPDPEAMAHRARAMNVLLGLVLALLVWSTTRQIFSWEAANLALALFVFSPPLIAHFSLVTTDGASALFVFSAARSLLWWRAHSSAGRSVCLGLVLGLLLLAKFSSPVIFVMFLGCMLVLKPTNLQLNPLKWNWANTAIAFLVAVLVVWCGYFFHTSHISIKNGELIAEFPNRTPYAHKVHTSLELSFAIPAGEYAQGLYQVFQHNKRGHPAFFLGQVSPRGGFHLFYPVAVLLKWPTITLILFVIGAIVLLLRVIPAPRGMWLMGAFPLFYFGMAMLSRLNLGERHVLPVYPFMLLFAGAVWQVAQRRRALKSLVLLAVLLQAADTLRYAPDYLTYFNIFVSPSESYKLLTDSNLDWGQGLLAVREYEKNNPGEQISLAYAGSMDPRVYGIRANGLQEGERTTGTVIVSATNLSGQYLKDPASYRWILQYPRTRILAHSMYVFHVPQSAHTPETGATPVPVQ
jgi:hypothetical protein